MVKTLLDFPVTVLLDEPVEEGVGEDKTEDGLDNVGVDRAGVVLVMDTPDIAHEFLVNGTGSLITSSDPSTEFGNLDVEETSVT